MPADNANVTSHAKHTVFFAVAGQAIIGASPARGANVLARNYLLIQNTGINPVLFRFENPVQQDGGDIVLGSMGAMEFKTPCPQGRLNFLSVLGTTVAVVEGLADG